MGQPRNRPQSPSTNQIPRRSLYTYTRCRKTFRTHTFDALLLSAGAHTLTLAGLRGPDDHTLFEDDVRNRERHAGAVAGDVPRAIGDKRTIYVVANGVVADFEDGIDRRASFVPVINRTTPYTVYYGNGLPRPGRVSPYDDFNFYDLFDEPGGPVTGKFRLTLTPAQNWAAYGRLVLLRSGDAFDAFLLRASGAEIALGSGLCSSGEETTFVFPPGPRDDIVGIELRQSSPVGIPACLNWQLGASGMRRFIHRIRVTP